MSRKILVTASFFGMSAVILGAYAAHGLEKLIDADSIVTFKTGVQYQMYHTFLLLFLGLHLWLTNKKKIKNKYINTLHILCWL